MGVIIILRGIPPAKEVSAYGFVIQVNPNCDSNPKIRNRNKRCALQHHIGITSDSLD